MSIEGANGSQASADPPEAIARKAKDGAREPAPGEANPLSRPEQRPGDRRTGAP